MTYICEDLGPYRGSGSPAQTICKRGHQHPAKQKCQACCKLRDQWRYDAHKEEKKEYQRQWRRDFRTAFGMSYQKYFTLGYRKSAGDLS